jgi:RNA polymerase sigma factor (sigma-70 family)
MASPPEIPEQYRASIEAYRQDLLEQARVILGSPKDAEEVVQETFREAFHSVNELAQAEFLGARLQLINRRNALDRLHAKSRPQQKVYREQPQEPLRSSNTERSGRVGLRDAVAKALETLPENMRMVVKLRYFEHRSLNEIAGRMAQPLDTVGRLLSDACMSLYDKLAPFTAKSRNSSPAAAQPSPPATDQQGTDTVTEVKS